MICLLIMLFNVFTYPSYNISVYTINIFINILQKKLIYFYYTLQNITFCNNIKLFEILVSEMKR